MIPDEIRLLCDWYLTCDRSAFPDYPFQLTPWQQVTGDKFFDVLTRETSDTIDYLKGDRPNPPIRLAGILKDLQALKKLSSAQLDDDLTDW
jgi:hypothetical protein